MRDLTERLERAEAELAAMKAWRDAVDDQLIISNLGTWESFPDARTALNSLLEWNAAVAVDPAVSEPARDLVAAMKARGDRLAEALGRIEAVAAKPTYPGNNLRDIYVVARQALTEWRQSND